ncbi:hypothetical protein ACFSRY_05465 [Pontibacter locisalis]|uniref:Outer membrane protein beta-barrel domain-containing protein n=1 Tax=Pontibacter locisalis TaxID=1719035 RepID=A0ABW5IJL4_9BACT
MIKEACGWLAGLLLFCPLSVLSQDRTWSATVAGGAVKNFRTPLTIQQSDAEAIKLDADFVSRPFSPPVYYDIRVSTLNQRKGWELKFTHHKLILTNLPPEVQRFSITDGFNLLTMNRLWLHKDFSLSLGGGIVITHPESTVRNKAYPENKGILNKGYYISGPTIEAAIARRFYFDGNWFVLGEGRANGSYVKVPVADGNAKVTNAALHVLLGIGFQLNGKTTSETK